MFGCHVPTITLKVYHIPRMVFRILLSSRFSPWSRNPRTVLYQQMYSPCCDEITTDNICYFQLLVTLRYLAKGDFYSEVADLHGVSRSSASLIVHAVVQAINNNLNTIRYGKSFVYINLNKK